MSEALIVNSVLSLEGKATLRQKIARLEDDLKKLPQVDVKESHHFSKDVYAREIFIPKGTLVVGKIHKFDNLNILSLGEVSVLSIEGVKRFKAPTTFVSQPGAKRVIYAHTDVVWTTIHGTDLKDPDEIEAEVIAKNYDEVLEISEAELKLLKGE